MPKRQKYTLVCMVLSGEEIEELLAGARTRQYDMKPAHPSEATAADRALKDGIERLDKALAELQRMNQEEEG